MGVGEREREREIERERERHDEVSIRQKWQIERKRERERGHIYFTHSLVLLHPENCTLRWRLRGRGGEGREGRGRTGKVGMLPLVGWNTCYVRMIELKSLGLCSPPGPTNK